MGSLHQQAEPTKTDRIPDRGWTPSLPSSLSSAYEARANFRNSSHPLETIVTNFVNVMETGVAPPVNSKRSFAATQTAAYATPPATRRWTSTESGRGYAAKAKATAQLTQPAITRPPMRAPPTGKGKNTGKTPSSTGKGKGKAPSSRFNPAGKGQEKQGYVHDGYNWHPIAKPKPQCIVGISASGSVVLENIPVANPEARESDVMESVD